jgi:hypothetical protein
MFERLRRRLRPRAKSQRELSEDEALRRQVQQELREAEQRKFEERQRLDSGSGPHGWGGWT